MRNVLLLVMVCVPAFGAAQEVCSDSWNNNWKEKCDQGGFQEMSRCFGEQIAQADKELNRLYSELRQDLVDPKPLVSAQRAWLRFRDAECVYDTSGYDCNSGIAGACSLSAGLCQMKLACDRIKQLRLHTENKCDGCPPRKSD
jgi:uncharacterized protein YecT (DUF1311 family)